MRQPFHLSIFLDFYWFHSSRRKAGASLNRAQCYFSGARQIEPGYPAPWLTTFSLIRTSFFYFKNFWSDSSLRKEGINLNRLIFKSYGFSERWGIFINRLTFCLLACELNLWSLNYPQSYVLKSTGNDTRRLAVKKRLLKIIRNSWGSFKTK